MALRSQLYMQGSEARDLSALGDLEGSLHDTWALIHQSVCFCIWDAELLTELNLDRSTYRASENRKADTIERRPNEKTFGSADYCEGVFFPHHRPKLTTMSTYDRCCMLAIRH